jgi:hypothetical protein
MNTAVRTYQLLGFAGAGMARPCGKHLSVLISFRDAADANASLKMQYLQAT